MHACSCINAIIICLMWKNVAWDISNRVPRIFCRKFSETCRRNGKKKFQSVVRAPSFRFTICQVSSLSDQASILFCWFTRAIDWVVLVQVLTLSFNHLITFPQYAKFTQAMPEKSQRTLPNTRTHLQKWSPHGASENGRSMWILWERWHHPEQTPAPRSTANLFAFQPLSH